MSPRSATSSRALAAFSVARTRSGLAGEDALGTRFEGAALQPDETADAALGDGEERVQPRAAEGHLLGRALDLHELAAAGHDDVHVYLGARVLGVAEVEHRLPLDDADADRGDAVTDRGRWLEPGDFRDRVGDRDEAARDGGGRSEEHTSELQSRLHLVCRLLLEKKKKHTISESTSFTTSA